MTLPALSNKRTPRKTSRKTSRAKATGAMVALALGAASLSFALPADASTAKLNGLCTKKELGKKTTKLICSKSGSLFRWRSRSTGTTSSNSNNLGGTSEAVAGLPGGSSGSGPATIGVAVLPFGNVPVGATAKVDLNCVGLPATPNTASQSLSFPAAGGSNQVTFTVSPPSSSNPTGSTCSAVATASVAAKLSVLVDGTPVAGPAANTVTTPAFTAVEGTKVTLLVDYTSAAPTVTAAPAVAPTLAPLPTVPLPTIAPVSTTSSAPTTTASPLPLVLPTSGRVEVATRVLTQVPITFAGVTAELLCSPGAFGQGYQSQTLRFDRPSAILNPSVQLGAVTPGFGGTACQVDFALQGEGLVGTQLRLILNGQIQTNTLTGTLMKSNSFDATKPFNLTLEISFPGLPIVATSPVGLPATAATTTTIAGTIAGTVSTATTTTTTTTVAGTATTPTQATVTLTRATTGNPAPTNLTGYTVTVSCTNAVVNGATLASADWVATYPVTGGTAPVSLGLTASSVCSTTVVSVAAAGTAAITSGGLILTVGGTVRGNSTNGAVTSGAIASPAAFAATVAISY
jgi:hypothetical protein